MKKLFLFVLFMFFMFGLAACDFFNNGNQTTVTSQEATTNELTTITTASLTTQSTTTQPIVTTMESDFEIQLLQIYQLALDSESFDGTYEEWLETVKGPKGDPGEEVILALNGEYIQWKYDSDTSWNNLLSLSELKGETGEPGQDGEDGLGIESTEIDAYGNLIITYTDDTEVNLGRIVTQYQVTFYDYNGYFLHSDIVEYGGSATPPENNPEREGYIFIGWSQSLDNITCEIDVFALYDVDTEAITTEEKKTIDYSQVYTVDNTTELIAVEKDDVTGAINYAYKVLYVENGILEQLTTWTSSDASDISFTTGRSTSESLTRGLSISLSTTFGVAADIFSASLAIEISTSIEQTVSMEESTSVTITYNLDEYKEDLNYAVFLTGNFEIYQLFKVVDGVIVEEETFFKIIGTPMTRLISSNTSYVENYITLDDYMMTGIDASNHFRGRGEGIDNDPYIIENEMDMAFIRYEPDAYYKLGNDIVIENYPYYEETYGWIQTYDFKGIFDGNDKIISNLTIDHLILSSDGETYTNYGLFYSNSGTIKNLNIDDFYISLNETVFDSAKPYLNVGIICGTNSGTIDQVTVNNSEISISNLRSRAGGVCGSNFGEINNTSVNYTPITGSGTIGGIAGLADYGGFLVYMNNTSYNDGTLTLLLSDDITSGSIGGFVGVGNVFGGAYAGAAFVKCSIYNSTITYDSEGQIPYIGIYAGSINFLSLVTLPNFTIYIYFSECSDNISDSNLGIVGYFEQPQTWPLE